MRKVKRFSMEDRSAKRSDRPPVCDYEGSDYQKSFWAQGGREYEDRVEAVAIKRLLPERGQRLLEVGAGAGRNTERYAGYKRIVLLDYSRTQLLQARDRLGDHERYCYVAGDVYQLPFAGGVFDGATMIRTLHHMAEPQRALEQVHAVMASEGIFILEYANKRNLKAILRWLFGQQDWNPFGPESVEFATLNFDFHPQSVRDWLAAAGYDLQRQLTVSYLRHPLLKQTIPTSLLVGIDSVLQWTGTIWQGSPSVFTRSRVVSGSTRQTGAFWKCPVCQSTAMEDSDEGVHCTVCGLLWPKEDGIYNFKAHRTT